MNRFLSLVARFVRTSSARRRTAGVARSLMESAGAGAGRDPHQAQELRGAARAYLSVVR